MQTEEPEHDSNPEPWEAEVKAMSERLSRESRRSGIIGFLGGAAVMGGVLILILATKTQTDKNASLTTDLTAKTQLATNAQQQATKAQQQTVEVKTALSTVLNSAVENLQKQSPAVTSAATSTAIDNAFDADPEAATLVVRVYIHISSQAQRPRAVEIAKLLRKAGYVVPGVDVKPQIFNATEIHYYTADSESENDAAGIAKVLAGAGISVEKRLVPPANTDKLKPRAYGLWLAANL